VAARSLKVSALSVRAIAVGWGRQGAFWLLHLAAARVASRSSASRDHVESEGVSPAGPIDLILIGDHEPWALRAATQAYGPTSLSESSRDDP
jgi:hypothetical protein